jgi:hypothetical protein
VGIGAPKSSFGYIAHETGPIEVALLISVLAVVHYVFVASSPHEVLASFVPDDAFCELQLARQHSMSGIWTFDRGLTTTTGFHLLNVYLMSWFPDLLKDPWVGLRIWMGVNLALCIGAVFVLSQFAFEQFGPLSLLALGVVMTTPSFMVLSAGILEYSYVLLIAALYVWELFRQLTVTFLPRSAVLFLLGFIGSLARSDFGGLPLAIFLAIALQAAIKGNRRFLSDSFLGLLGAVAGLGAVCLHNYLLSGHMLSGSVLIKALWGERLGYAIGLPIFIALLTLGIDSALKLVFTITLVVLVVVVRFKRKRGTLIHCRDEEYAEAPRWVFATAGLAGLLIYLLTYGADPSCQSWYTANFVLPFVLFAGSFVQWVDEAAEAKTCLIGGLTLLMAVNTFESYYAPWPSQSQMVRMANYITDHPLEGRIGGWNVGTIGYLLNGRVTNLDGLMNDQIYEYIRDDNLSGYLREKGFDYLVDFPHQLNDPRLSKMGGYEAGLNGATIPIHVAAGKDPRGPWNDYSLYTLNRDALK